MTSTPATGGTGPSGAPRGTGRTAVIAFSAATSTGLALALLVLIRLAG